MRESAAAKRTATPRRTARSSPKPPPPCPRREEHSVLSRGCPVPEFTTLPPRPRPANVGAVLSFVFHAAIVLPYLLSPSPSDDHSDPIDRLVVFLVPPDREGGRHVAGPGIQWSGLHGNGGAVKDPLPKDEHPEETLELGTRG